MRLLIPGRPVAKGRPRLNRKTGKLYTPRDTKAFEDQVAWHVLGSDEKFEGDVTMQIAFYMPTKKPVDIDNLVKAILDGLQKGRLIANDSQIKQLNVDIRYDAEEPRTEIVIEAMLEQWVYCHSQYVRINRVGEHYLCSCCGTQLDHLVVF